MIYTTLKPLVLSLVLTTSFPLFSYADFYIIPVLKKMKNIVTVAKSGGQYRDIHSALNAITDANETNPYLIYIGPGEYTVAHTILMKPFVSIQGSGENITIFKGPYSGTYGIIKGAKNTSLGHLSIINHSADFLAIGMYNVDASPTLHNLTLIAGDSYNASALYNKASSPTLINVTAIVDNAADASAIYNDSSSPYMTNVTATCSGIDSCIGITNYSSSPTMNNVTAIGIDADISIGISNHQLSSPIINNTTASGLGELSQDSLSIGISNQKSSPSIYNVMAIGAGGTESYGINNDSTSYPMIRNSILNGTTDGLKGGKVGFSTIIGGTTGATCSLCIDGEGQTLDSSCNP